MAGPSHRASAYYWASVDRFLATDSHDVLGALAAAHTHALEVDQRQAWEEELDILKAALSGLAGTLYLEFDVPRLGSRIDAVLVSGPAIFPIEFKCGERQFRMGDYNQVGLRVRSLALRQRPLRNRPIGSKRAAASPQPFMCTGPRDDKC